MDCAWPLGPQGCDGGEDDLGFLWILDRDGLPTTARLESPCRLTSPLRTARYGNRFVARPLTGGAVWLRCVVALTGSYGPYLNADGNCHAEGSSMAGAVPITGFYEVPFPPATASNERTPARASAPALLVCLSVRCRRTRRCS